MAALARLYLETSVISYLGARLSRDLRVAAHQEITAEWWQRRRGAFDLFVSQLVVDEASAGDPVAAARRMGFLEGLPVLSANDAAQALALALVDDLAVPREALEDALHIAIAAVHGLDYMLSWNCKHIAKCFYADSH